LADIKKKMKVSLTVDKPYSREVKRSWLRTVISKTLATAKADTRVQLDIVITNDETVHQLNREYRNIDKPTDVLAFALAEESGEADPFVAPPEEPKPLGEVIVSYPTAVKQATEHGHSTERELALLVVHGVLHLLGYDHDTDAAEEEMQALERQTLARMQWQLDPPRS
jgi:probable rRNA maturation factor